MSKLLKIGITQGDINGVGYEVILKALSDNRILEMCTPVIYGSAKAAGFYKKQLGLDNLNIQLIQQVEEASAKRINLINTSKDEIKVDAGTPTLESGRAALEALEAATADILKGKLDALVTAPINKSTIQSDKFHFPGHTEYLESKDPENKSLMILASDALRIALVTSHIPLKDVTETITEERIVEKLRLLNQSLKEDFSIVRPRIAVLSLNPHAGDNGLLGNEEENIIKPAMQKAIAEGIVCGGPLAADGFFGSNKFQHYDAVLAMYHDQGLAPFKAIAMEEGVNITAGLSFVRTSPAHGTAYDIAGKGIADELSMLHAIYSACDIVNSRRFIRNITTNPLVVTRPEDRRGNRDQQQ